MITYETLRKIVNDEKNAAKLAKLPEDFFKQVKEYLDGKVQITESKADKWELDSARRLLQDLTEIRERKLLTLALFHVRSGVASENMTDEEKEFFDSVVNNIKNFQRRRKEAIEGQSEPKDLVAITTPLPEFVGINMKVYGPFNEGDVVTLPEPNADLLVKKNAARRIQAK